MVTNKEQIDTDSPVVPNAIYQRSVEIQDRTNTDQISKMSSYRIVFCHVLLIGFALSSPVEIKEKEKKSVPEVTTHTPIKVTAAKNLNNEQVQNLNNAQIEKSSTKKRNVPRIFTDKNEYPDDDFYEGRATDDYDGNHALRTYADNYRNENLLFDSGKHGVNDYRYFDDESRRKRTANLDSILNNADSSREPEIRLSPEFLRMLAAYGQQQLYNNNFAYGRRNDMNNAFDIPDDEVENEIYDRPENFFDRYYDQRYQNWANFPRSNKFMNHQGKGFMGYSKLRVPIYKRTIL